MTTNPTVPRSIVSEVDTKLPDKPVVEVKVDPIDKSKLNVSVDDMRELSYYIIDLEKKFKGLVGRWESLVKYLQPYVKEEK